MMEDMVTKAMNAMAEEAAAKAAVEPDLRASGLVKAYGDRTVVNGMDVCCSCGEIVGLLGPNGASRGNLHTLQDRVARRFPRRPAAVLGIGHHPQGTA